MVLVSAPSSKLSHRALWSTLIWSTDDEGPAAVAQLRESRAAERRRCEDARILTRGRNHDSDHRNRIVGLTTGRRRTRLSPRVAGPPFWRSIWVDHFDPDSLVLLRRFRVSHTLVSILFPPQQTAWRCDVAQHGRTHRCTASVAWPRWLGCCYIFDLLTRRGHKSGLFHRRGSSKGSSRFIMRCHLTERV